MNRNQVVGILLCGGSSRRMGRDKSQLTLKGSTFASHCRRAFDQAFERWVAVGAFDSPPISDFEKSNWITDSKPDRGAVEGLTVGIEWASQFSEWSFVSTVDVPLIETKLAKLLISFSDDRSLIVMPYWNEHRFGLTAVYRNSLGKELRQLVEKGFRKISNLPDHFPAELVDLETLRKVDPTLRSFMRINDLASYQQLVHEYGDPSDLLPTE